MELKEIKVSDILANFYQPRTKFDKEKIKELAESILSNGLINPITITPDKKRQGKYMIVSGERRWQAHKVAKLNTIQTFIKEYSTDGQFMVESLIENIHREDLIPLEKGKFAKRIMKVEKISDVSELSKRLNVNKDTIYSWFDELEVRKKFKSLGPRLNELSSSTIRETKHLPEKQREELLKEAIKEDFGSREMRKRVSEIKSGELSKRIKSNEDEISRWIDDYNYRKQTSDHGRKSSTTLVRATRGLDVPEREKV